jgi:hypothetical protein
MIIEYGAVTGMVIHGGTEELRGNLLNSTLSTTHLI